MMLRALKSLSIKSFCFVLLLFFSGEALATQARIAIVIDDICGDAGHWSEKSLALRHDIDLTYAVLPNGGESCLSKFDDFDWKGSDKILHMPMEPLGDADPGEGAIKMDDTRGQIITKLSNAYMRNHDVIGFNNHMGSAVTQSKEQMNVILPWINRRGMFFLDSGTTATKACELNEKENSLCIRKDLFLDHHRGEAETTKVLERAKTLSQKWGRITIVIGHAYPETTNAIKHFASAHDDVMFVPISEAIADHRASSP